jgi:hypothetical protein
MFSASRNASLRVSGDSTIRAVAIGFPLSPGHAIVKNETYEPLFKAQFRMGQMRHQNGKKNHTNPHGSESFVTPHQ